MGASTQSFMTSAQLVPGDAKIKSWHDGWGCVIEAIPPEASNVSAYEIKSWHDDWGIRVWEFHMALNSSVV
jgi:hypothetical protein